MAPLPSWLRALGQRLRLWGRKGYKRLPQFVQDAPQSHRWLGNLRSWSDFTEDFTCVSSMQEWGNRLQRNVRFYQVNYMFAFGIVFLFCVITNPLFLVVLALLCAGWYYVLVYSRRPIVLAGVVVSEAHRTGFMIGLTVLVLLLTSVGPTLLWILGATSSFVLLHASFRAPNLQSKTEDFVDRLETTADLSSILVHELTQIPPRQDISFEFDADPRSPEWSDVAGVGIGDESTGERVPTNQGDSVPPPAPVNDVSLPHEESYHE